MLQNEDKKVFVYLFIWCLIIASSLRADETSHDTAQEIEQEQVVKDVPDLMNEEERIMGDEELPSYSQESSAEESPEEIQEVQSVAVPRRVNDIIIVGNKHTSEQAMLNYIPYKVGEIFTPKKSGMLIRNLYKGLNRFRNITLKGVAIGDDKVDLYVIVEEKPLIKDILFEGNKAVQEKEIFKKVNMDIPTIDEEELKVFAEQIKKIYYDKGFQRVSIDTRMEIGDDGRAVATFIIDENKKSRIRRIRFEGNEHFSEKDLRNVLFTREEWVLSFLDKSGTFHPDRLEADKHMIEQYYQNHGFMQAKVVGVEIDEEKVEIKPPSERKHPRRLKKKEKEASSNILDVKFIIEEGNRYTISEVKAPGSDEVSEAFLLANIPIRPGQYYSRERIANTIKMMEFLWGNFGYIFAHIDPSVQVDQDEKTVKIEFISDLGKKIKLNRITIKGNKKTRDKVIRRRVILQEGANLTQGQMDATKNSVQGLGYFEREDGVNWKIKRLNPEEADLDLIVREAKTGSANIQLGFGGTGIDSVNALAQGVNVKGSVADTNLFGSGTVVNLEGSWSKEEQTVTFHLGQPWLFDKPISGAMDVYHRRPSFDQLRNVRSTINSKLTGASLTAGFITPARWSIMNNSSLLLRVGGENMQYLNKAQAAVRGDLVPRGITVAEANEQYNQILMKEFTPGDYMWLSAHVEQDHRNNPIHTSRGQKFKLSSRVAIPSFDRHRPDTIPAGENRYHVGYAKLLFDYTWYTPLINEQDLVFKLHLFFGLSTPLKGKTIPFNELFHIGGDTTVRGFSYGQIGPQFLGDTIGAKKAMFISTELIFPITEDLSMKGVVFYDGGAGWDNPYTCGVNPALIENNSFDYRHAVGFGIRLLRPMPVRIDWGFKLDARTGENESQVHFGMTYDW